MITVNLKKEYYAFKKSALLFFLIFTVSYGYSQAPTLSKNATVSIITCGTGNESYSLFGHTAVRITDQEQQIDVVYNYGAFDFTTPNFVAKFAKGDLQYFVIANSYEDFIIQYHYEKRAVYEQQLQIPLIYKQKLFDNLNATIRSESRFYTYKFIDKNCTTMVVELLNNTLGKQLIVKKNNTNLTYRTVLYPYFDHHFYDKLGISIIFGTKVDQKATKIFLPFELNKSLQHTNFQNHPIAPKNTTILDFEKEIPKSWWNNPYTYLLFLCFIIFINKKAVTWTYFVLMGLLGVFFLFMGFYSLHPELEYNYNILLFNPSLLLLIYFYKINNKKWIRNLVFFNLFSLGVYLILLINKADLLIVLPLIITSGVLLTKVLLKNKKQIF